MINYEVIPLNGQGQFDLTGVKFNGKSFIFWKKKSTQVVKEAVVVFDKKYENIEVKDGVIMLSLKGLSNEQDLYNAIGIFKQIMMSQGINAQFHFVIDNNNERKVAEALGNNLGIQYGIQDVRENEKQELKVMEEQLKNNLTVGGSQTIERYNNGKLENITVYGDVAIEEIGPLSSKEEQVRLLEELMKDSVEAEKLRKMDEKARSDYLNEYYRKITNREEYLLEGASEQYKDEDKKVSSATNALTEDKDGKGITKFGIVRGDDGLYETIEQYGDDNIRVVEPNVKEARIDSGGVISNEFSNGEVSQYTESKLNEEEIQSRDDNDKEVFYIEGNLVLNSESQPLGYLGNGWEYIEEEKSIKGIDSNGNLHEGIVGSINGQDLTDGYNSQKTTTVNNKFVKKKVLRQDEYKSEAFVSLPVIMFILSALLLIGSVILLFVLD